MVAPFHGREAAQPHFCNMTPGLSRTVPDSKFLSPHPIPSPNFPVSVKLPASFEILDSQPQVIGPFLSTLTIITLLLITCCFSLLLSLLSLIYPPPSFQTETPKAYCDHVAPLIREKPSIGPTLPQHKVKIQPSLALKAFQSLAPICLSRLISHSSHLHFQHFMSLVCIWNALSPHPPLGICSSL